MTFLILIPALFSAALAVPTQKNGISLLRFIIGMALSFLVVLVPLFFFLVSALLLPEWKGECLYGWQDCFIKGKLVLTPLALYATAALYAVEVLRVENRTRKWIVIGVFQGAVIALICFAFGLGCILPKSPEMYPLLIPSFYVAIWYFIRSVQLIKESRLDFKYYFYSMLGSLPFWAGSWLWSLTTYAGLPDQEPPGCFVVTAASRGHQPVVGPFFEITRHGRRRQVNRQLLTFWEFEGLWQSHLPRSHTTFRFVYNRIGPVIAAQIKWPWLADVTCFALKPLEMIAFWINRTAKK